MYKGAVDSLLDEYLTDAVEASRPLFDVADVERRLRIAARERRDYSYSELLLELGMRFTRPKMRTLCKVLDAVDVRAKAGGEPELAVLVVREGDRIPGQGWWTGRRDYKGEWTGPDAKAYVGKIQAAAFRYWKDRGTA